MTVYIVKSVLLYLMTLFRSRLTVVVGGAAEPAEGAVGGDEDDAGALLFLEGGVWRRGKRI